MMVGAGLGMYFWNVVARALICYAYQACLMNVSAQALMSSSSSSSSSSSPPPLSFLRPLPFPFFRHSSSSFNPSPSQVLLLLFYFLLLLLHFSASSSSSSFSSAPSLPRFLLLQFLSSSSCRPPPPPPPLLAPSPNRLRSVNTRNPDMITDRHGIGFGTKTYRFGHLPGPSYKGAHAGYPAARLGGPGVRRPGSQGARGLVGQEARGLGG